MYDGFTTNMIITFTKPIQLLNILAIFKLFKIHFGLKCHRKIKVNETRKDKYTDFEEWSQFPLRLPKGYCVGTLS